MSFQELADGRSRELRSLPSREPNKVASELIASVFKLQTEVSRLKSDVQRLGTPKDTVEHRAKIAASNDKLKVSAKNIGERLKAAAQQDNSLQIQKIVSNFQAVLTNLEGIMKQASARQAASLPRQPDHIAIQIEPDVGDDGEPQVLLHTQQQQQQASLQLEGELQYNEVLIEERDDAIQEISHQIGEVHEIFQDLATLVNDQGHMVDDFSDHIERTATHTQNAATQLRKAETKQRWGQSFQCWIMVAAAFVLIVLFIVLVS